MMANINAPPSAVRIGARASVTFEAVDESLALPQFWPVEG